MDSLVRLLAHVSAISLGIAGSLYLPANLKEFTITEFVITFFVLLSAFIISWSAGLVSILRYAVTAALLAKTILVGSTVNLFTIGILLGLGFLVHTFTSYLKTPSEWLNTFKGLWIDWLAIIPLFPIFGFTDLLLRTDLFYPLLGYWLGSTFYTLTTLKAAEFIWHYALRNSSSSTKDEQLTFIHHLQVFRSTWNTLHVGQLLLCLWLLFFLFGASLESNWVLVDRWQIAFAFGCISSLLLYLGPIAAGSALSPEELRAVQDAVN